MLTIEDCFKTFSLEESALNLISKVTYQPRKAYIYSVDGENFWEFGRNLTRKVRTIRKSLEEHKYEFGPCKKIIRKTKLNKVRDIYLSNWKDKIVERWLNDCLCTLLHKWFSRQSYAFRVEGVCLDSCIMDITQAIKRSKYFIKRDITQFFYTIDHEMLLDNLRSIVDEKDYLFHLLLQRVRFRYCEGDEEKVASVGIPFGSSIAPVLANVSLTPLDKEMSKFRVRYFRYSDDFLIAGGDSGEVFRAGEFLDGCLGRLKFGLKETHKKNISFLPADGFVKVNSFKHLGLEFHANGSVKLAIEKQRKIINFYKNAFKRNKRLVKGNLEDKIKIAVGLANGVIEDRIRSAAIVDYYLKHVSDKSQLRNMDRIIIELLIGLVLDKKFRKKDFQTISPGMLREVGLISLVHRNRLHKHGHIKVNFLSLYNDKVVERHETTMLRRKERIDHMRMARKINRKVVDES